MEKLSSKWPLKCAGIPVSNIVWNLIKWYWQTLTYVITVLLQTRIRPVPYNFAGFESRPETESTLFDIKICIFLAIHTLKVVTSEKIGGSGVTSTLGTWYGGVVMGVLLSFNEAAILYRDINSAPSQKQNIIIFAANNSRCCQCHVAPTIIL